MGLFSKSLERLRQESGFATPYAFYHRNGGRHVFPFTFSYYLKLERGAHLPRPQWLPILINLLRIHPEDEQCRRLITDYLRDHFGPDNIFQSLLAPLLRPCGEKSFAQQAVKRLINRNSYHLTPEQFKVVVRDAPTYWAFECLTNDHRSQGPDDLASATGLARRDLEAGLQKLAAHKLVRPVSHGKFKSALSGKFPLFPHDFPNSEDAKTKLARYVDEMRVRRGSALREASVVLRSDGDSIHRAVSALNDAMEASVAFSVHEKSDDSGFFLLKISTSKVVDF
ncbi:MAG: hypothetical protein AAB036_06150 [Elusimicrobiota bacterium]